MMHGAESNDIDSASNTHATSSIDQQCHVRKVDCAIIGAGAAGLQCAATLLEGRNSSVKDDEISLVVLEARERVGGRILSTYKNTTTVGVQKEVLLCRDHGAAWVHGIHESNPMMKLLAEEDDQSSSAAELEKAARDQQSSLLDPIFDGNPWVRPDTILHRNGRKGEDSLIAFFVNGKRISNDKNTDVHEIQDVGNDPCILPTMVQSSFFSRIIQRHYRLLREIVLKYDCDEYNHHDSAECRYNELNSTNHGHTIGDEDNKELVNLLMPFYLFLIENWNGISMKETNVDQVEDLVVPHQEGDDDDDVEEEEKKDDRKLVKAFETDEEYVSVGDFVGPHCKVKTGMFTVLKPLIRKLEGHQNHQANKIISMGEEVIAIIDEKSHVRIETKSGNTIEAKCCVSTLPLGVLQNSISIQNEPATRKAFFQPRLRNEKIEAIHSLWSGAYKKVFLTFDHVFWPKDPPIIGLVRRESTHEGSSLTIPGKYLLFYNLWAKDRGIPSIEAILCGDLGKWAFQKSDSVIQQAVIEFIEAAMGLSNLGGSCTDCHVTRWEEDEFTRGSYSAFQLETLDEHIEELGLSEWDGRLVFAGEATENDHMGSVHAALMSGKRAAKEVSSLLSSSFANH